MCALECNFQGAPSFTRKKDSDENNSQRFFDTGRDFYGRRCDFCTNTTSATCSSCPNTITEWIISVVSYRGRLLGIIPKKIQKNMRV